MLQKALGCLFVFGIAPVGIGGLWTKGMGQKREKILTLYLARDSRMLLFLTVLLFGLMTMPFEVLIGVAAAGLLICLYNGRRGTIRHKLFYYWFYPVHLAALWALGGLLLR